MTEAERLMHSCRQLLYDANRSDPKYRVEKYLRVIAEALVLLIEQEVQNATRREAVQSAADHRPDAAVVGGAARGKRGGGR